MKRDFKPYKVGTIFNPLLGKKKLVNEPLSSIEVRFPSRLNAMAIDPSKITLNENMVFSPGEIIFSVNINLVVKVSLIEKENSIEMAENSERPSLIRHAIMIMRETIGVKHGLKVLVKNQGELKHCGLGSSSRLISAVAVAINEIYGNPINKRGLVKFLAQNHGEEIEGHQNLINPVQCIGGSASSGINEGGLQVIAGKSTLVGSMRITDDYMVLIGIPKDFVSLDSKILLEKEIESFPKFSETGRKYAPRIAYRVLHEVLPALAEGDLKPIGDLIFDYRFKMGSIENCSFVYPKMVEIAHKLSFLKEEGYVDILSLSSVGPAFFTVAKKSIINYCREIFEQEGLRVIEAQIANNSYDVIK